VEFLIHGLFAYEAEQEYEQNRLEVGGSVVLVAEADNSQESNAVRVDNENGAKLGYLPRAQARWAHRVVVANGHLDGTIIDVGKTYRGSRAYLYCRIDVPKLVAEQSSDTAIMRTRALDNRSGVYSIFNRIENRTYIGSSLDIGEQLREHIRELENKSHSSEKLQQAWNTSPASDFEFKLLEAVDDEGTLSVAEQRWLDTLKPHLSGYNASSTASPHRRRPADSSANSGGLFASIKNITRSSSSTPQYALQLCEYCGTMNRLKYQPKQGAYRCGRCSRTLQSPFREKLSSPNDEKPADTKESTATKSQTAASTDSVVSGGVMWAFWAIIIILIVIFILSVTQG